MVAPIDMIFATKDLERRFGRLVVENKEEIGGVFFYKYDRINNLHWKRHQKIFGDQCFGMITDWLICPNVSNLRDREYQVSDLKQLIGIAEQSAESRGCSFLHFHSHPSGSGTPSKDDYEFWWANFNKYGWWARSVIVTKGMWDPGFKVVCHSLEQSGDKRVHSEGRFLAWNYINRKLRYWEKKAAK